MLTHFFKNQHGGSSSSLGPFVFLLVEIRSDCSQEGRPRRHAVVEHGKPHRVKNSSLFNSALRVHSLGSEDGNHLRHLFCFRGRWFRFLLATWLPTVAKTRFALVLVFDGIFTFMTLVLECFAQIHVPF